MVRKSTLALIITISILMSYGGCDGDGGSTMDEAPPPGAVLGSVAPKAYENSNDNKKSI